MAEQIHGASRQARGGAKGQPSTVKDGFAGNEPLTCIHNVYTFISMDVRYGFQGQAFEWDAVKAAANLRKHHISFEKACEVFFDPFVRVVDASGQGEAREAAIGLTEDWVPLFVVHVVRQGDIIRIISARRATPSERRDYEHD